MEGISLYSIQYYERSVFKGSYRGINFRLAKGGDEEHKCLTATAWKGPFILEKSPETPVTQEFEFSDEGLAQADAWLQEQRDILL
jgi:hypothetical protein